MTLDRLARAFTAIVKHLTGQVKYACPWPARVLAQSADLLSVDIVPDSDEMPSLLSVPIRGLPGVRVKLATGAGGARVLLQFEGGDPSRPIATLFEQDGMVDLRLGNGTRPVACVGDMVAISTILPDGISTLANGGGPVTGILTLAGYIAQGQDVVKAP
jgi:hypothetical protein